MLLCESDTLHASSSSGVTFTNSSPSVPFAANILIGFSFAHMESRDAALIHFG